MRNCEAHSETTRAKWSKEIKRLDGYRCAYCGSAERLESHHITPLWKGGAELELENGITLCHYHHRCAHDGYGPGHRAGTIIPIKQEDIKPVQAFVRQYQETRIIIEAPRPVIDRIKAHAESQGESVNRFIARAVDEAIERDRERSASALEAPALEQQEHTV